MRNTIRFLGAAGTVTGSKFLLSVEGQKILVDCGLFQGLKTLRLKNWEPFPVDPKEIDSILLTHAHLDHSGYLPLIVREGFKGKIYCTPPTRALSRVILIDSGKIQEEDAANANLRGFSKHHPAKPLYGVEDAERALRSFSPVPLKQWTDLGRSCRYRFTNSGHILGSALIEVEAPGFKIAFTGDLGRSDPLTLPPPDFITTADYLVVESTYGDRVHSPVSPMKALAKIVNETVERKGQLLIPAFAVGRTQDLLYLLSKLKAEKQIPDVPIFLDSPMGMSATEIFTDFSEWHRLSSQEIHDFSASVTMVKSRQQSDELLHRKDSSILIAGSGMLTGGRILSHLARRLPDERNCVALVGFQAAGTRGSLLRSGIGELKIYGEYISVRARIEEISSLSAHADQREILSWMGHFLAPPKSTFIVHGEPQASDALRVRIQDSYQWNCTIPKQDQEFSL
jgi:metallo-beta-lactamase family protein